MSEPLARAVGDRVFKALGNSTRRALLDRLRDGGGQTLIQLEVGLGMTRFGVTKHLKVLEDANLMITLRLGRRKVYHLDSVPIQEVADCWMATYANPPAPPLPTPQPRNWRES
jgi:DNA-binding transcriptional ArsR family regulator